MTSSGQRGQATAEYVGVVLLVCLALAVTTAVAAPWMPRAVTDRIEYALCVVGLDICDSGHARFAGVQPCVTQAQTRRRGTSTLIAVVDAGGQDALTIQVRSDGSYLVTAAHDTSVDGTVGIGADIKGLVDLSADVSGGGSFGSGTTLEIADQDELRRLLGGALRDPEEARELVDRIEDDYPASRVTRYRALEGRLGASASASLRGPGGSTLAGTSVSVRDRAAVGRRTRAGVDTWYYEIDARVDGPLSQYLPQDGGRLSASWERSDPPVLTVTSAARNEGAERVTEARMVLTDPDDRAAARDWLLDPGSIGDAGGRRVAARMGDDAVVQEFTYWEDTHDEGSGGLELRLGVGGGFEKVADMTDRTLVGARILNVPIGGQRLDCLSSRTPATR